MGLSDFGTENLKAVSSDSAALAGEVTKLCHAPQCQHSSYQRLVRKNHPTLFLAPMEGVTDAPMRAFFSELGGITVCVTEFIRITSSKAPPKVFKAYIPEYIQKFKTKEGIPIIVQLLGGNPECMAQSALTAVEMGAQAIDLNFGCPAPTVNRHDGGAVLLKTPERIYSIVSEVRKALPASVSVSAKLRLGWDDTKAIYKNAESVEKAGADWITIHGRTRLSGYQPPIFWEPIAEVRKNLSIPVVANGDIFSLEDFKRCQEVTGCEHFMLGRGLLSDPFLGHKIYPHLFRRGALPLLDNHTPDWVKWVERFIEISLPLSDNPKYISKRLKQWLKYAQTYSEMKIFDHIKRLETYQEILDCMRRELIKT